MLISQGDKKQIATGKFPAHSLLMPGESDIFKFEDITGEAVGYRLSVIRKAFGFEKSEIADLLEIDRPSWTLFETGKRVITYERAMRIYNRFGIGLDFIILGRVQGLDFATVEKLREAAASLMDETSE